MALYCLRLKETKKHIAVVAAETCTEMFWLASEFCTPRDCEYALMFSGGFVIAEGGDDLPEGTLAVRPTQALCVELAQGDTLAWADLEELGSEALKSVLQGGMDLI